MKDIHLASNFSGFTAYATADRYFNFGETIIFDATRYNHGGDYSTGTSTYYCPVSGYYYFSLHFYISNWREIGASIELDRVTTTSVLLSVLGGNIKGTTSVVLYCDANQEVSAQCINPGELEGNSFAESSFSGLLIYEATA